MSESTTQTRLIVLFQEKSDLDLRSIRRGSQGGKYVKTFMLFFLTFSILAAYPKKLLFYTVASPARGLLNRENKLYKKPGSAHPPPSLSDVQIII